MYVVYINLLYFLSIFLFTYNKNLLSQKIYTNNQPTHDGTRSFIYADDLCITARRAKLGQIQGGVAEARGPAKIRQRGVCNNFFTFYTLKISLFRVFTLSD